MARKREFLPPTAPLLCDYITYLAKQTLSKLQWTLQQDGAPAHTARTTMDYLKKEHINCIEPHMWPPNSPDLNPMDYAIWGALQQRVYHQRPVSYTHLTLPTKRIV